MMTRLECLLLMAMVLGLVAGCGEDDHGARGLPTTTTPALTVTGTATATATLPPATATPISSNLAADVNGGGCYPIGLVLESPLDMLDLVNPEWSPVLNGTVVASEPVLVHGSITGGHGDNGGDFPATHVRSDQNTFVDLDPEDAGRLATGNGGEIALEWEVGAYPDWAWGSKGDRVVAMGRWIFDCGHPGGSAGHCSDTTTQGCAIDADCRPTRCPECSNTETCVNPQFGYSSEIHPPFATAVIRRGRGGIVSADAGAPAVPATRTDVFVSAYAGGAGDRCVLTHQRRGTDLLTKECYPLKDPVAADHLNDRDFVFDVPLPPKPANGRVSWRIVDQPLSGVRAALDVTPRDADPQPHLEVSVRMTQATADSLPTGYAATLFAGWKNDSTPLTHVRVSVDAVSIHNALQRVTPVVPKTCSSSHAMCESAADCPTGESCTGVGTVKRWRLQVAVNGEWRELTGLDSVSSGDVIPQSAVFDQYLPSDGAIELLANGDGEDCIHTMLGKSLKQDLAEIGFGNGVNCLLSTPHDPGAVHAVYAAPDFGAGADAMSYQTPSVGGEGGSCSTTGNRLCVLDADCPSGEHCVTTGGAFSLAYRIQRLP